ncbi:MAG: type IV toxin-antitoxin system AbiEi family antitoxin domain-containing protein [Candidatus Nanopelagicales bacterium]
MPRLNPDEGRALLRLGQLLHEQEGVVTAEQALAAGLTRRILRDRVAAGQWQRLHRGVLLATAAGPTLPARMWAAHLATGGLGVVGGAAAGHAWGLLAGSFQPTSQLLVLVPDGLHVQPGGLIVRRVREPMALAHPARRPPVLSVERTVLDLVRLAPTDATAAEVVLRACRLRLTTPDRILGAMSRQPRVARRRLLASMCQAARAGIQSPLELEYGRRVARPHGLPVGRGQARDLDSGGVVYRDLVIEPYGVVIELDGRLGHEAEADILRDHRRDNRATLTGLATLRFGWLAVIETPCEAAWQVEQLLRMCGWRARARPCGPSCPLRAEGRAA